MPVGKCRRSGFSATGPWMWTRLTVTMTPKDGGRPVERAGNTLSVLNKQAGRWIIARDANMLAPVAK